MENKSHFEALLALAPKEKREELEQIFRKHDAIENEDDPVFQVMLIMGIYGNYMEKIPDKMRKVIDEFNEITKQRSAEILALSKINERMAKSIRNYALAALAILLLFTGVTVLDFLEKKQGNNIVSSGVDLQKEGKKTTEKSNAQNELIRKLQEIDNE
jgi:predicted sugar kinase